GSGVDDSTVTAASFTLTRDGTLLVLDTDYTFGYDATNKVAQFTPLVGIWQAGAVYVITVDNSAATGIKDLAGNSLLPTDLTGVTKFTISLELVDYGDAPTPYPTLLANNGARHILSDGLFLGATVTSEPNGQPSADANADSGDDGVVFNSVIMPGTTATITVTASQAGKLDAWIDWGGDDSWSDVGDQIFTSQSLVAGANVLHFTVPSTVTTTTYARFRVSSAGGLAPTGLAQDGEVEDYKVSVTPPVAYTTKLYNAATGVELLKDSTGEYVALAGTTIQARVFANDLRSVGAAGGVFSAFADLTRDNAGITWSSLIVNSAIFPNAQSGAIDGVNQIVDEAGGLAGLTPTGAGTPELLFSVNGAIAQSLTPGTVVNVTPDAADNMVSHPTTIYGSPSAVSASYTGAKFIIPLDPWQNPSNPLDVDASGAVVPLDALLIINELNLGLGGTLPQSPVPPNIPPPYFDVNGDGSLTPLDALLVISFLNGQTPLMAGGAPPTTPIADTAGGAAPAALLSATAGGAPPTQQVSILADSAPQGAPLVAAGAMLSAAPSESSVIPAAVAADAPFSAAPIVSPNATALFVNAVTTSDVTSTTFAATGIANQVSTASASSVAPSGSASFTSDAGIAADVTGATPQQPETTGTVLSVAQAAVSRVDTSRVGRSQGASGSNGAAAADFATLRERALAQLFGNGDDSDALELADVGPRLENAWNRAKDKWNHG
ncbi:MAG TPA: GEVED domain-containing protein, partial [Pirellulales bacterium]